MLTRSATDGIIGLAHALIYIGLTLLGLVWLA